MTLYKKQDLPDGSTVIVDNHGDSTVPEETFVLKAGQWEQITALPHDQQRVKLNELVASNATGTAEEQGVVLDEDNNKGNERDREEATGQR